MSEARQYYQKTETAFRDLCPEQSGHMNFGMWPAPSLRTAQENLIRAVIALYPTDRPPPRKIVEAGSGWGGARALFHAAFPDAEYIGINMSARQVEWARELNHRIPNTSYHIGAIEDLPAAVLADADAFFAIEAAFHFKEKATLLHNLRRANIGVVAIADFVVSDRAAIAQNVILRRTMPHVWSAEQYGIGLKQAGYSEIHCHDVSQDVFAGLANFLAARKERGEMNGMIERQLTAAAHDMACLSADGALSYAFLSAATKSERL